MKKILLFTFLLISFSAFGQSIECADCLKIPAVCETCDGKVDREYFSGALLKNAAGVTVVKIPKPFKSIIVKGTKVTVKGFDDKVVDLQLPCYGYGNAAALVAKLCACNGGATPTDATVKTTAPVTIGAVTYAIGTPLATINAALAISTNGKLTANPAITGATKTKITYDANGLVTAGADATNGDILTVTPITIGGTIYPIGTTVSVIENALAAVATLDWKLIGNAGTVAGTNFIGTTDAVDLVTKTNSAERMRVTAAGNVGINTSNPQAKLHIQGNGGSAVVPAAGNGIIISEGGGGGARIYLEHPGGLTTAKVMLLETTSGLTKFSSLSDNGGAFTRQNILTMNHVNANVGIGTQTAQNKLDIVTGVANTSGLRLTNLTSASPATTGGAIGVDANGDVVRIASTAALAGYTSDAAAAIGGVAIGGQYFVIVGNSYGMSDGAMKVRRN